MILLSLLNSAEKIVVTLNEKRTLDDGYYLFQFTHMTTREVINKIYQFLEDESDFQDRFNEFTIDTATVFSGASIGQWIYKVYEQVSSSNTDPDGLNMVERGIMKLLPVSSFAFEEYTGTTSFKQYEG
jgi:hypothetical protein